VVGRPTTAKFNTFSNFIAFPVLGFANPFSHFDIRLLLERPISFASHVYEG